MKLFEPLLKDVCVYSLFTLPPNGKDQLLLDFYPKITQSMTVSIRTRREKYYNEMSLSEQLYSIVLNHSKVTSLFVFVWHIETKV